MKLVDPLPYPIGRSELTRFGRDGFVVLRRVIPVAEVDRLREIGGKLIESPLQRGRETLSDGWDSFRGAVYLHERFAELALHPRLLTFVTSILGPNIHLVSSQLVRLQSVSGARTTRVPENPGWHRDIYGMAADLGHHVPRCAIKAIIWLTDTNHPKYGGTMFAPGSQELVSPLVVPPGRSDPPRFVSPATRAGDVVLFENRTWHAGGRNTSERERWSIILQWGYRWLSCIDAFHPKARLLCEAGPVARQLLAGQDITHDGHYEAGYGARPLTAWVEQHKVLRWSPPGASKQPSEQFAIHKAKQR